ncbi:MAG: hypothetical protein HXY47_01015 [Nitrospirae bacterium]|nr:hypothetical protein [Nitrospirota bacterium]
MKKPYRYQGLVDYIAGRYMSAVEIGIGSFPDVAFALQKRGVQVFATDILPFYYKGLKIIKDDIMEPDLSTYSSIELIYSLRPPFELIPFMLRLAKKIKADLIVKPLHSEYPEGKLMCHETTTFFLWSFQLR